MSEQDYEQLTLFPEDSPASHSALLDQDAERMMTAISGRKCLGLYRKSGPLGLLAKMLMDSQQWFNPKRRLKWRIERLAVCRDVTYIKQYSHNANTCCSSVSSKILKKKDTKSSHFVIRLVPSERIMNGCGFLLLPTPTATVATHGGPNQRDSSGRPGLQMAAMWKTPIASDANNREFYRNSRGEPNLSAQVKVAPTGGQT